MAMTKVYNTGGVNSMRMSYHIDQKCMKPMGGNPPENYEECMQARLCRPMIAKHSHIHRTDTCKYTYIYTATWMFVG